MRAKNKKIKNPKNFQFHETPEQKFKRKMKYIELKEAGQSARRARIFRDWSLNRVRMICEGRADPIR